LRSIAALVPSSLIAYAKAARPSSSPLSADMRESGAGCYRRRLSVECSCANLPIRL